MVRDFEIIGQCAFNAVLSYYSNRSKISLSADRYIEYFVRERTKQRRFKRFVSENLLNAIEVRKLKSPGARLDDVFLDIYRKTIVVSNHINQEKFLLTSMVEKIHAFRDILVELGYKDFVWFDHNDGSIPANCPVIYIDRSYADAITDNGDISKPIKVRLRTMDQFEVAESAYNSGLLIRLEAIDETIYDYVIYPDNNASHCVQPITTRDEFNKYLKR